MSLLSRFKSFFKSDVPQVKSEYEVYRRQRLIEGGAWGQRPFYQNHAQSMAKELPVGEWRTLTSMARKLYWNVGLVNSAIDQRAMLTVGKAMRPIYTGEDKAWGKLAEICLSYLKKGRLVFVDGRLQTDRWDDKGETHYRTTVVAQSLQILDRKPEEPEVAETPVEDLAE